MTEVKQLPHDSDMAIRHFESVLLLARNLASEGVSIYEHKFDPLFFGSWYLIAGTRHRRVKFFWDGRDECFTVEQASFSDGGSRGDWQRVTDHSVDTRRGADPFQYVQDYLTQAQATQ